VGAQLTLKDTSVKHNTSLGDAGGMLNIGAATTTNDSLDTNSATGVGGGIDNTSAVDVGGSQVVGTMTLDPATSVSNNTASAGGGIDITAGTVTLNGATVKGNHPDNCVPSGC
jgi:hypothetical protein